MAKITPETFRNVFKYYADLEHQRRAVEDLYEQLDAESSAALGDAANWLKTYRQSPSSPQADQQESGICTPQLMHKLTGYAASEFDDVFCNDCNRLFKDTGFDEHLDAMQMLMANMMHETCNFLYMKEISDGLYLRGRSDLGHGPNEGELWKGAGVLQLTGKYNYSRLAEGINDPRVMEGVDYVSNKYPFTSARIWIEENNLLNVCLNEGFDQCCRRINGGWTGYEDRLNKYHICQKHMR